MYWVHLSRQWKWQWTWALLTYDQINAAKVNIKSAVSSGLMPKEGKLTTAQKTPSSAGLKLVLQIISNVIKPIY
ncbi:MAG: hypothetical protein IPK94_05410 [Saprospiraceae bacterium]|nr:hypothetical protein [Saprospiraceae bacterium]